MRLYPTNLEPEVIGSGHSARWPTEWPASARDPEACSKPLRYLQGYGGTPAKYMHADVKTIQVDDSHN
jgi:hypothetical protein